MGDACCDVDRSYSSTRPETRLWDVHEIRLAAVAGVLLVASVVADRAGAPERVGFALLVASLVAGAWTFVPSALRRLRQGQVGVGTLMTIAAAGAVALGEIGDAALLALLYSIAEGLEGHSVARTRRGLRALLDLVPVEATVRREGVEHTVAPENLQVGDVMVVRPGERVATDGTITAGRSSLDTSAITGEPVPIEGGPGDEVFAGFVNGTGALQVVVTATARDNSLARIVHTVEAEHARKGTSQRLADRIARPLVPAIMAVAAIIVAAGVLAGDPRTWAERALIVLVAASPCALAISVPVTVAAAVGAASRFGVLIKGGAALEALGAVRTVAFDKTGTLTRGRPQVTEVVTANGHTTTQVLTLAAALERRSEHPLADAIVAAADPRSAEPAHDVEAMPGDGLTGRVDGRRVRLGRPGWIDTGILAGEVARLQATGATTVLLEDHGALAGAIAVADQLRPETPDVVAGLHQSGYDVAMLTGDNAVTATAVAQRAGVTDVHAELRPAGKATIVRNLRASAPTAMVGDGINDAPALAAADVGVAMGAIGSDVAIETADVALMGEDLRNLPRTLAHARRSRAVMRQNIGLSLAIIGGLIPLALTGTLGLAAVVLIHEVAEVAVIANALRAGRAQPHDRRTPAGNPTAAPQPAALHDGAPVASSPAH